MELVIRIFPGLFARGVTQIAWEKKEKRIFSLVV